ncbi:unnamed protein product [Brachionus calyciflorus]|uniref:Uncharacterized protein n=1 Tax=Brachionus calyciflorus TaxID=104777 RepID=A0A813SEH6_9BILA|nr:unnamed protein product [Brachionus calyciflorus]
MIPLLIAFFAFIGLFNLIIFLIKSIYDLNIWKFFKRRKNSIINFVFRLNSDFKSHLNPYEDEDHDIDEDGDYSDDFSDRVLTRSARSKRKRRQ